MPVTVRILDRDYQVACPPEQRAALGLAANYLNARMREIRDAGRVSGTERIAVMAALNLAHEKFETEAAQETRLADVTQRVQNLRRLVFGALDNSKTTAGGLPAVGHPPSSVLEL